MLGAKSKRIDEVLSTRNAQPPRCRAVQGLVQGYRHVPCRVLCRYKRQQQQHEPTCPGQFSRVHSPGSTAAQPSMPGVLGDWARRAAAAAVVVAFTASAVLLPPAVAPASAHEGMDHSMAAAGSNATAASRFRCTPLTGEERISYFDLRGFTHKIHTSSPAAQALFDQGLLLAYNFNHPEALKSFQAGLVHDPYAAMLHWGVAYTLMPYANVVWGAVPTDQSYPVVLPQELVLAQQAAAAGVAAAEAALSSSPGDPQLVAEAAYLRAVGDLVQPMRDTNDPNWPQALAGYAANMEALAAAHPSDPDAPALAAEARMNLSPWVHWSGPLGRRVPVKAVTVVRPALSDIATSLSRSPDHPLAAHLLIHLTEGGTPGGRGDVPVAPGYAVLGEAGADLLAAGPAHPQMGHLTHMPSHTYLRVGRWHDAVTANKQALEADEAQAGRCVEPYMPEHNAGLLQFAAAMSGEYSEALATAHKQVEYPVLFGPTNMADGRERATLPLLYARFAKWEPLLALTPSALDYSSDGVMIPPGTEAFSKGVWHYTRALALASAAAHADDGTARSSLVSQLQAELSGLSQAVDATPPDPITRPGEGLGIYSPGFKGLGEIELMTANARAAVLRGDWRTATSLLQQSLAVDGRFGYTEPPRQYQPLRECLGWVLLQQGRLGEAEQVYLTDLAELPHNPWALKGLQQVYSRQQGTPGTAEKLIRVDAELADSWSHADKDIPLNSSCPSFSD